MPLVPFHQLMADAEAGGYAVGYFESWNLESLLAVADAAEAARSPVILGFSGIYLTHPRRVVKRAAFGLCRDGIGGVPQALRAGVPAVQRIAALRFGAGRGRPGIQSGDVQR